MKIHARIQAYKIAVDSFSLESNSLQVDYAQDVDKTEDGGGEDKLEVDEEVEVNERDAGTNGVFRSCENCIRQDSTYPLPILTATSALILTRALR